jgi:hypothetical protein
MCVHIMQYTSIQYYVCAAVHKPHEIRHEILAMSLAISRIASRWSVSAQSQDIPSSDYFIASMWAVSA